MYLDSNFYSVFVPALIIVVIFTIGYKLWVGKQDDELEKAITLLKISIFSTAFLSMVLWLMLPLTPSLSTFGFPETVEEISKSDRLLTYIQDHNKAIVRTTEVVNWFIFIFVWGFLTAFYSVIKSFSTLRDEEYFVNRKRNISDRIDEKEQSSR